MVYRVYVEKKKELAHEAASLLADLRGLVGVTSLEGLRILNRYDVENIGAELFEACKKTVFSEPQIDKVSSKIDADGAYVFAVEYLPGQFDQRADSAAQCIQILSEGDRPTVRTAKLYLLSGALSDEDKAKIKKYVINPVECREASLELPETLTPDYRIPDSVEVLEGFTELDDAGLDAFIRARGLAMDEGDIRFCRDYFRGEGRNPTITEIKMIDTYWSDHCRHTTFLTTIDRVEFEDDELSAAYDEYVRVREMLGRTKPQNLMDIATIAARALKKLGKLTKLDESDEINACTVKITVEIDGKKEPWLLLFKNETHNHPTEIEPFGGAATCIGGAIRDPLSGRSYVYAAMRVTGAANPTVPVSETIPGKLPQRKIVTTAAAGYSSYGNQIGLATGQVDEIYHDGYVAKHMEIGAVVGAAPEKNVRRECPAPGDVVILLGGRTGRDGCGGATGSSKSHNLSSLESCGAEVQKGNAPEERKLQRLFRNPEACRMIKRCNDFGAGGVSVAAEPRLVMRWNGVDIVNISREFLNSNGAEKHIEITPDAPLSFEKEIGTDFAAAYGALARDLNVCSRRGLAERFDSTIGAGTVLMPFGGKNQLTPIQAMAHKIPVEKGHTDDCSVMAWGYNPMISEKSPYHGAYLAVVESISKLIASGAKFEDVYLTFQEYFEKPMRDGRRWGKPLAALLGAFKAQMELGVA